MTIISNENACVSDFMRVDKGHSLFFSSNGAALSKYNMFYIYEYDANKSYIGRTDAFNIGYTYEGNANYVRVCLRRDLAKFQVENDAITAYSSFTGNSVIISGDNIKEIEKDIEYLNSEIESKVGMSELQRYDNFINEVSYTTESKNKFDVSKFIDGKELVNGELRDNANTGVSDFIKVDEGHPLYFSTNGNALTSYVLYFIYEYNANKVYQRSVTATAAGYVYEGVAPYIRICIRISVKNTFQVENDAITPYTPYVEPKTELKDRSMYSISANPLQFLNNTPELISCFLNVGCIGDSLASGVAVYKDASGSIVVNSQNRYEYSWGQYLARMTGNKYYNWSAGGLRTDTWLSSSYATECFDGNHKCQAYIIGLGQNDNNAKSGSDIGSASDINISDYNQNANTFYGRYGKIIQKIKEVQPKAKIFVVTDPLEVVETNGYNDAVREMATKFKGVFVLDMHKYWSSASCADLLANQKRYGHYNAVGYFLIAKMMMTYIDWIMQSKWEEFREIENIGTDWHYYD